MSNQSEFIQERERTFLEAVLPIVFFILTIILVQQIINIVFPIEDSTRIIAKIIIDTALIIIGLALKHKIIAEAILYAGVIRFALVFFQLSGFDPSVRVIVLVIAVAVLLTVGFVKFGKSLSSDPQNK